MAVASKEEESSHMIVNLYKHGSDEFVELLNTASIPYEERKPPLGMVMNAPTAIEIIQVVGGVSAIPSLAIVLKQWLMNKANRRIIIDNVTIEGDYSQKELEQIVSTAKSVHIVQTKPDKEVEND